MHSAREITRTLGALFISQEAELTPNEATKRVNALYCYYTMVGVDERKDTLCPTDSLTLKQQPSGISRLFAGFYTPKRNIPLEKLEQIVLREDVDPETQTRAEFVKNVLKIIAEGKDPNLQNLQRLNRYRNIAAHGIMSDKDRTDISKKLVILETSYVRDGSFSEVKNTKYERTFWNGMINHLLSKIFVLLPNKEIVAAASTCRSWRAAALNDTFKNLITASDNHVDLWESEADRANPLEKLQRNQALISRFTNKKLQSTRCVDAMVIKNGEGEAIASQKIFTRNDAVLLIAGIDCYVTVDHEKNIKFVSTTTPVLLIDNEVYEVHSSNDVGTSRFQNKSIYIRGDFNRNHYSFYNNTFFCVLGDRRVLKLTKDNVCTISTNALPDVRYLCVLYDLGFFQQEDRWCVTNISTQELETVQIPNSEKWRFLTAGASTAFFEDEEKRIVAVNTKTGELTATYTLPQSGDAYISSATVSDGMLFVLHYPLSQQNPEFKLTIFNQQTTEMVKQISMPGTGVVQPFGNRIYFFKVNDTGWLYGRVFRME